MKRLCCRRPCASRGWSWVISFPPHLQVLPSRLLSDAIPREPLEPITSHPACEGVPMSCDWISQLRESVASESTETGQSSTLLRSHTRPFLRTRLNRLTSAGGGIRLYWLVSGRPKGISPANREARSMQMFMLWCFAEFYFRRSQEGIWEGFRDYIYRIHFLSTQAIGKPSMSG